MTIEEAKKLDHFLCSDCSSDDDAKRSLNVFPVSPSVEAKKLLPLRMLRTSYEGINEVLKSSNATKHC
nr:chromatin remodeling protein ebs [Quercus suber]